MALQRCSASAQANPRQHARNLIKASTPIRVAGLKVADGEQLHTVQGTFQVGSAQQPLRTAVVSTFAIVSGSILARTT